jgi:hypothetical protein
MRWSAKSNMAKRNIEETFQAIRPRGQRGIPSAPAIGIGVTGDGDLSGSLSQAGQQIAQLQAAYQQQAALISANTVALQSNTTSRSGTPAANPVARVASGLLGGGLGLLSPIISGIANLFGGSPAPVALPAYTPPAPVSISANLTAPPSGGGSSPPPVYVPDITVLNTQTSQVSAPSPVNSSAPAPAAAPQITVTVHAMDSQSFMDRSSDIANAVREAMLNSHSINDVIASL